MNRRRFLAATLATPFARGVGAASTPVVVDEVWTDRVRNREVPVRIRVPAEPGGAPVILFSHGLGGSVAGGTRWGEAWSAHGYVCVHLQHHGSDEALWKTRNLIEAYRNLKGAMTVENGLARVGDVRFVLDEIARRRTAGERPWASADTGRVGMSGHSFGARTTLSVVSQAADPRISAAIAMSPMGEKGEAANRARSGLVRVPFLSLTGTEDRVPILDDADPAERRVPFEFMPAPDKYLLVLAGADHMVFNGEPLGRRWSDANREVHAPLIERVSLTFWDAHLRGDARARGALAGTEIRDAVGRSGEWLVK